MIFQEKNTNIRCTPNLQLPNQFLQIKYRKLTSLDNPLRCYGNASTRKRLNGEIPQKPVFRNLRFFWEISQNGKILRDFRIFLRRFLIFKVEVFPLFILRRFRFLKKVLKLYFVEAFPLFFEAFPFFFEAFPFFEKTFKTLFC